MNKVIIALFFTLSLAAAQDACTQDLYSALPLLQKTYMDYNNRNWAAIEGNIEKFIPIARLMLNDCAGVQIPDSPRVQACIDDTTAIARLFVPLIVDSTNKTALLELLTALPTKLTHLYSSCINPPKSWFLEDDEFYTVDETVGLEIVEYLKSKLNNIESSATTIVKGAKECFNNASAIIPALTKLVSDVVAHAGFETVNDDLVSIFSQVNGICDACGIPQPKTPSGPVDVQKCLLAVDGLVVIANEVISADGDIFKMIAAVQKFIVAAPATLSICGIQKN